MRSLALRRARLADWIAKREWATLDIVVQWSGLYEPAERDHALQDLLWLLAAGVLRLLRNPVRWAAA